MNLKRENLGHPYPDCIFNYSKGFIRFNYDRDMDMVYITPCCNAKPKKFIKPIAWKSEYFISNFERCLEDYHSANLQDLNDWYFGTCLKANRLESSISGLCTGYTWNKSTTIIENSISRTCNLNCIMCNLGSKYNSKEMKISNFVYNKISKMNLDTLLTTTAGEPFIDKEGIFNLLERSKQIRCIYITTNGSLLNEDDIIRLSKYYNLKITVSLDSINKETYEKIRLGSNFDTVFNNVLFLKKYGILDHINYVLQLANINECFNVNDFFQSYDIKVDYLLDNSEIKNKELQNKLNVLKGGDSYLYKYNANRF